MQPPRWQHGRLEVHPSLRPSCRYRAIINVWIVANLKTVITLDDQIIDCDKAARKLRLSIVDCCPFMTLRALVFCAAVIEGRPVYLVTSFICFVDTWHLHTSVVFVLRIGNARQYLLE
jgi:hypothetical protein